MLIDKSLPEECRTFLLAHIALNHWGPGQPEPTVLHAGQWISASDACRMVLDRTDMRVPPDFYHGADGIYVNANFEPVFPTYAEAAQETLYAIEYHRERLQKSGARM